MLEQMLSDQQWLNRKFTKSNSIRSKHIAGTSLSMFKYFCQYDTGIESRDEAKTTIITKYYEWFNQTKPEIQRICTHLGLFIDFLNEDHDEIVINRGGFPSKAKSAKTIKIYFGFIKDYLRKCYGIRLTSDDIHDFVDFPKTIKEPRQPIDLKTMKLLFGKCDPARRALYYVLVSSGMRLSEGLALKKTNLHLDENPVRITILAEDTKTKEGRETYISREAVEKLML